jgi:hypothetical protein
VLAPKSDCLRKFLGEKLNFILQLFEVPRISARGMAFPAFQLHASLPPCVWVRHTLVMVPVSWHGHSMGASRHLPEGDGDVSTLIEWLCQDTVVHLRRLCQFDWEKASSPQCMSPLVTVTRPYEHFVEIPAIAEAPPPIAKVLGEGGAEFQPLQRGKAGYTFRRNAFPDGTIVPTVGVAK